MTGIVDVAALGKDVDDGVALTGEGDDSGGLDSSDDSNTGVEQTDDDFGVGDESLVDDALLDEVGALLGGESCNLQLADEGNDDLSLGVDGEAVDGTELRVHAGGTARG